jgi:hypothetical protein
MLSQLNWPLEQSYELWLGFIWVNTRTYRTNFTNEEFNVCNLLITFVPRSSVKVSHRDGALVQVLEYSDLISILYFRHGSNGTHTTGQVWFSGSDKEKMLVSSVGCLRQFRGIRRDIVAFPKFSIPSCFRNQINNTEKKEDSNSRLLEISLNKAKTADVYTQNYLSILE